MSIYFGVDDFVSKCFFVTITSNIITWKRYINSTIANKTYGEFANKTYGELSGTSMAVAHVAGAAAFLFSHFPDCTNNQIRNAMIGSTTKPLEEILEWDQQYGWGIVNVGKAYDLLTKGCVDAGGVYPNSTVTGILSHQAGGGRVQIAVRVPPTRLPTASPTIPNNAVTASPNGQGSLTCARVDSCGATLDTWTGIGGYGVYDLIFETKYLTSAPSRSTRLTELLEIPSEIDDNYGSRMKGWLKPPMTGDYTFWIASGNQGELWLSTDSSSVNKVLVCWQIMSAGPRNWTVYPEQMSLNISLVAGQAYYYEVRVCVMFTD